MWQKADEIICDDKDREYLRKIRKEYKNLVRNVWNPFDKNHEKILAAQQLIDFMLLQLEMFWCVLMFILK